MRYVEIHRRYKIMQNCAPIYLVTRSVVQNNKPNKKCEKEVGILSSRLKDLNKYNYNEIVNITVDG